MLREVVVKTDSQTVGSQTLSAKPSDHVLDRQRRKGSDRGQAETDEDVHQFSARR
tara:strand:- start:313 stop:477 length:165 start_codon:yes stop_codon:yes gene_type:complete